MLLQHADKRRTPIMESYNRMTHSPLVYRRHCSKKPLLDRYVLRAEVQSPSWLSWLLGYGKIQKKLEETYPFPIYLPWNFVIPAWNFKHITWKELPSPHYGAGSLFPPSVMNRSKCHWCRTGENGMSDFAACVNRNPSRNSLQPPMSLLFFFCAPECSVCN